MRNRLVVRGSGKLTGTVRYGELELERGGQIAGNISVLNSESDRSVGAAAAGRSPLFGGGERTDDRRAAEGDHEE